MTDHLFPHGTDEAPRITTAEAAAWVATGIAIVIYVVALVTAQGASYDDQTPIGWMNLAGALLGITAIPAVILTGLRQLVPALRRVSRGESKPTDGQERRGEVQDVRADLGGEHAE